MPHPCPHHCPPERGGAAVLGVLAVVAAVVVIKVVVAILTALLITLAVIAGLALLGGAVYAISAVRSGSLSAAALPPPRPHVSLGAPPRQLEAGRHLHLHFHGMNAADIAAIVAAQHGQSAFATTHEVNPGDPE